MRETTAIDKIADNYTVAMCDLFPTFATSIGLPGYDDRMDDLGPEAHQAYLDLNRSTLAELDRATAVDATDEVTVAAMRERLGIADEIVDAGEWRADLNVIASPLQARDVFDLMPTQTEQDWANIAARAAAFPQAMAGYVACLRQGIADGFTPPIRQVRECIKQAEELADPGTSFFSSFFAGVRPDGADPSPGLAADLDRAAQAARQSYSDVATFLTEDLLPKGKEADACGRERYGRFSRLFVGAEVDLDETYEWGVEELARVTEEQESIARQIAGPGATVAEAGAVLDADPARQIAGTAALRGWMQATADEAISALNGRYFDIPDPVRTIECRIAPTHTGVIYYTGPSDDWTRPGRMWWSVPDGVDSFTTWSQKTTVYHEGVPGHHLQVGQAVYNAAELNLWRRLACWMSGHGEGWALYAERLMEEFGFMDDLGDRLGLLDGQRLRAVRVVIDLGVHLGKPAFERYGGGTWDAEKAWALLRDNTTMDTEFARFELNRYLGWPGQAPSYKIGQRLWEQTRAAAQAAATSRGETFSLKDFHTRALNLGSVPMDVLRNQLVD